MMNVEYNFYEGKAYNQFTGQLAPGATFGFIKVDNKNTSKFVYDNLGASLVPTYNLKVIATVTIENISVVKCIIPVTITGSKPGEVYTDEVPDNLK